MSVPNTLLAPSQDSESAGILIKGQLALPEVHECSLLVGAQCFICMLQRLLFDGEDVSIDLVVHDIDDESV